MKNPEKIKRKARLRRHKRIRSNIAGTSSVPRLSLFRSNKEMFVQLINDEIDSTLASASSKEIKAGKNKTDIAKQVGRLIAKKAISKKIKKVVFDRGGYKYHGRVKAVADGARENGLEF